MPGVGPVTAMAVAACAPPMDAFGRGRDFPAWPGLPGRHSSGGQQRPGRTGNSGASRSSAQWRCSRAPRRGCWRQSRWPEASGPVPRVRADCDRPACSGRSLRRTKSSDAVRSWGIAAPGARLRQCARSRSGQKIDFAVVVSAPRPGPRHLRRSATGRHHGARSRPTSQRPWPKTDKSDLRLTRPQ
ncbi:transposase [Mangrovicoccus ximenensis]|uniref:transposase n=1 Tax=Mangrovicoccus ximenensis TaxID=1911570 RepID=UPI0038B326DC